ncbi:MAG: hypothetical protein ACLP7P_16540 [Rhodomicrobium sp.]
MTGEGNYEAPTKHPSGGGTFKLRNPLQVPGKKLLWSGLKPISFPLLLLVFAIVASGLILVPVLVEPRNTLDYGLGLCAYGIGVFFLGALIAAKLTANEKEK